jgi:two-component system sensor histidine kinase KdpD
LLKTGALEATEVCLRRAKVSLSTLLESVLEDQSAAVRSLVRISTFGILTEIEVDAQMVRVAILQLIDNAAKYSVGRDTIDVTVTQNNLETTIEVANFGCSIRPEEQERIFERFYRGIEAVHGPSGTGLGLSIVKKTAEAHGGRAWAECNDDRTRVFFTVKHSQGVSHG